MTALTDPEDNPPNEQPQEQRKTVIPPAEVNAHLIALSLNEMTGALGAIRDSVAPIGDLTASVKAIENQHTVTLERLDQNQAETRLAGGIAAEALRTAQETRTEVQAVTGAVDRIEAAVGKLARSMAGVEECTRSLYLAVFPEREYNWNGHDPEVDSTLGGELVPFRRAVDGE